jgi:hypothetical protein
MIEIVCDALSSPKWFGSFSVMKSFCGKNLHG